MDLRLSGWYASVENTKNGGDCNERIVEDIVAAASIVARLFYWNLPFCLCLFGGAVVHSVKCFVPVFADGTDYRTHAGGSIGDSWSVSHITPWTSEGSQLANRQNG